MEETTNQTHFTLVILAAGLGSRFGGLKQLTPIAPNGECILDFSIYDALQYGVNKIVLIIRKETHQLFQEHLKKIAKKIEIIYVFQDVNTIPVDFSFPARQKPWGTGHALLMAKNTIQNEPFIMINADDFYGRAAYKSASESLRLMNESIYGLVAYPIQNTLSQNGTVSRGECKLLNGELSEVIERFAIEKVSDTIYYDNRNQEMDENTLVSMNFWLFDNSIFQYLEIAFKTFLEDYEGDNKEFLLPDVINNLLLSGSAKVKVTSAHSQWFGVTYSDDLELAKEMIASLIRQNQYPETLWL
ncbi:MAG: NTP transferase domain-containing protein [Flavobacteriaceae bacterium]|nr:NTP transferase domain-containing protein [Flavobacteriaceae bacterium]